MLNWCRRRVGEVAGGHTMQLASTAGRRGRPWRRRFAGEKTFGPSHLRMLTQLFSRHHVDDGVLDQRREDEDETDDHPDVDGLYVGDSRKRGAGTSAHRRRRQDRQQTYGDSGRRRLDVDPEGHPGQDDDEDARDVHLDEEEADISTKYEANFEARKRS